MADHKAIFSEIKDLEPLWDNWYIKEEIGSGASSMVYRIEANRGNRTDVSALKVEAVTLEDTLISDKAKKATLLEKKRQDAVSETNIMYSLKKCPYIVGYEDEKIVELKHTEGYALLIRMEYLECLQTLVKKGNFTPSEETVSKLAFEIGSGIKAAHDQGVIHRDVKPANFFVSDDGTFKLGDFNISKSTASARSFAGTEGYIAPEIYKAKRSVDNTYTKQADIYSFGICLYQLMNDYCFPFEDNCLADEAIDRRMNGEVLPLPKNASPAFGRVILRACAYSVEDRYKTMDEMLADIKALSEKPTVTPPPAAEQRAVIPETQNNPFSQRLSGSENATSYADDSTLNGGGVAGSDSAAAVKQPKTTSKGVMAALVAVIVLVIVGVIVGCVFVIRAMVSGDSSSNAYPDDAEEFEGHHYMLIESDLSWRHAEEYCIEQGGHLVSINSKAERIFVEELTEDSDFDSIRIGGYRVNDDPEKWYWTDGSDFSYTHWDSAKLDDGSVLSQPTDGSAKDYYIYYVNSDMTRSDSELGKISMTKGYWSTSTNSTGTVGKVAFVCEWE